MKGGAAEIPVSFHNGIPAYLSGGFRGSAPGKDKPGEVVDDEVDIDFYVIARFVNSNIGMPELIWVERAESGVMVLSFGVRHRVRESEDGGVFVESRQRKWYEIFPYALVIGGD